MVTEPKRAFRAQTYVSRLIALFNPKRARRREMELRLADLQEVLKNLENHKLSLKAK